MDEFSRKQWIDACQFHDLGQKAVLDEVAERVRQARKSDKQLATVVFDLDSTLYEVAPRTHAIIKDWLKSGHELPPKVLDSLNKLKHEEVRYSLKDTFESVGLLMSDPIVYNTWKTLKDYWWDRFFSSEYLKFDIAYPGAPAFLQKIHKLGAAIVYLTGRDEKKMFAGTLGNLKRDGFPLSADSVRIFMKQSDALSDADHKRQAARHLEQSTHVVASFENEPHNVVALFEAFPNALHVFMETICSDKPARALHGLYRITGFSDLKES